jgi:hypothetical protein
MILPPDHPDAPKYWMNETSGVLKPVIEKYLRGGELGPNELGIFRAYLRQWLESPVWNMGPVDAEGRDALNGLRKRISSIDSMDRLGDWLQAALDQGIDPL